jgi:hypothetical protein
VSTTTPPITAVVGQVAGTTTTIAPGTILIGPWDGFAVGSVCLEPSEIYQEWVLMDEADAAGLPAAVERRPASAGLVEVHVLVTSLPFTPVSDVLAEGFADAGIAVVGDGCDATVTVIVEGEPLHADYQGSRQYVGAIMSGSIELASPGRPSLTAPIGATIEPPETIVTEAGWVYEHDETTEAPYFDTVLAGLCSAFNEWIVGPFDFQPAFRC